MTEGAHMSKIEFECGQKIETLGIGVFRFQNKTGFVFAFMYKLQLVKNVDLADNFLSIASGYCQGWNSVSPGRVLIAATDSEKGTLVLVKIQFGITGLFTLIASAMEDKSGDVLKWNTTKRRKLFTAKQIEKKRPINVANIKIDSPGKPEFTAISASFEKLGLGL